MREIADLAGPQTPRQLSPGTSLIPGDQARGDRTLMADPARVALERALANARADRAERLSASDALIAELEAALAASGGAGVPLCEAAFAMGIGEEAARKRAKRGAGYKLDGAGHWMFPRSYVEAHRRVR